MSGTINKVIQTTKTANAIVGKAGGAIFKTSFNTAKQLARLYRDAGMKAFELGTEVVKKTVELTLDNQKQVLKTSGEALKEAAKHIRDTETELETMTTAKARKSRKTPKRKNVKKEVTIDDLI